MPIIVRIRSLSQEERNMKRRMALTLVNECEATVPNEDNNGNPVDIPAWLGLNAHAPMNLQLLE